MAKVDQETSKTAMFLVMNVLSSVTIIMVRPRCRRPRSTDEEAPPSAPSTALTRPSVPP